jgi:hypothetical protein
MTELAHRAEQAVADGQVTSSKHRHYDVQSGDHVYTVRIEETDSGMREPRCHCIAANYDKPCHHALAALIEDTRLSARERAWATAIASLRTLFQIVEDEDTPTLAEHGEPGGDEATRTALLEALDAFDRAHDIDNPEEN